MESGTLSLPSQSPSSPSTTAYPTYFDPSPSLGPPSSTSADPVSSAGPSAVSLGQIASGLPKYLLGGGIALAILLLLGCGSFWWKRRRRHRHFAFDKDEDDDDDEADARREFERSWRKIRSRDVSQTFFRAPVVSEAEAGSLARTPLRRSYDVLPPRSPSPLPLTSPLTLCERSATEGINIECQLKSGRYEDEYVGELRCTGAVANPKAAKSAMGMDLTDMTDVVDKEAAGQFVVLSKLESLYVNN